MARCGGCNGYIMTDQYGGKSCIVCGWGDKKITEMDRLTDIGVMHQVEGGEDYRPKQQRGEQGVPMTHNIKFRPAAPPDRATPKTSPSARLPRGYSKKRIGGQKGVSSIPGGWMRKAWRM